MFKKFIFGISIVSILLFANANVYSMELKPLTNSLDIRNSSAIYLNDSINITFDASANPDDLAQIVFSVSVQDQYGNILKEQIIPTIPALSREVKKYTVSVPIENAVNTKAYVFIIAKTSAGRTLSYLNAGTVSIDNSISQASANKLPTLNECVLDKDSKTKVICSVSNAGKNKVVNYTIHAGSVYGESVAQNNIPVNDNIATLDISMLALKPGLYEAVFTLFDDSDKKQISFERHTYFHIDGPWASIKYISVNKSDDRLVASVTFVGGGTQEYRAFKYWVLSGDAVCNKGIIELKTIPALENILNLELNKNCNNPAFVGVLYDGKNEDGSYNIIDTFGEADFAMLIKADSIDEFSNLLGIPTIVVEIVSVILLLFIVIGGLYVVRRFTLHRGGGTLATIIITASSFVFAENALASSAMVFYSSDLPNVEFFIQPNDNQYIGSFGFTFGYKYVPVSGFTNYSYTLGNSPTNTLSVSVNGRATTTIQHSISQTVIPASVSVPTSGSNVILKFTANNLCGSAFSFSRFVSSFFGRSDCDITYAYSPSGDSDLPRPSMVSSGVCAKDQAYSINLYTAGNAYSGNPLKYYIEWGDSHASYIDAVPGITSVSHTYSSSNTATEFTVNASAVYNLAGNLATSTVSTGTILCGTNSVLPPGTSTDLSGATFYASPSLVPSGGSAKLYWTIDNREIFDEGCSISTSTPILRNITTSEINGNWTSYNITNRTVYTLRCKRTGNTEVKRTTTVDVRPTWNEAN